MEDEYLFEPDYEDSCSILHTTNTATMADGLPHTKQKPKVDLTDVANGPPPAKQKPKADLIDAKTMADGPPTAKNKPKPGYRQCPICNEWDSNLKKHVKTHHLPIYLDPQMVCWMCEKCVGSFGCLKKISS